MKVMNSLSKKWILLFFFSFAIAASLYTYGFKLFFFSFAIAASLYTYGFKGKLLDMTYHYDENTIYWPTAKAFKLEKVSWGITEEGWWYASNEYSASEHGGTHVDAPIHFAEKGRTIEQIPLEEWIGPAVKIDVTEKCEKNRDYLLDVHDIKNWEKKYGKIPDGAWVIMYTGIDTKYYPDKQKVLKGFRNKQNRRRSSS